jgi:hypothetical protein
VAQVDNRDGGESYAASAGYEPTRASKFRVADQPPPLPAPAYGNDGFGIGDEAGLRMLAALETLTSLEPDYSDDLAAEASVTIIESAGYHAVAEALAGDAYDGRPLQALLRNEANRPDLLLNGYETFLGDGEEATVEIVEVGHAFDAPEPPRAARPTHTASLAERLAAANGRDANAPQSRFFKALSDGS